MTEDKPENDPLPLLASLVLKKGPKAGIKYLPQAGAYSSPNILQQPLSAGPCAPRVPELAEIHPLSPLGPSGLPGKAGPSSSPDGIFQRYSLDRGVCRFVQTQADSEAPWSAVTGRFHPLTLRPTLAKPGSDFAECGGPC